MIQSLCALLLHFVSLQSCLFYFVVSLAFQLTSDHRNFSAYRQLIAELERSSANEAAEIRSL
jgi:hypothetical protein